MIKTKDALKALFETGDKPTQQDFIDLLDSLVGKGEPVASNVWQPPNSPVYLGTDQELTCTHPEIVNENYSLSISQEIAGIAGQTNVSINFDSASEASYSQSDALYGTDFIDGKVRLHNIGNSEYPSNVLVRILGDSITYSQYSNQNDTNFSANTCSSSSAVTIFNHNSIYFSNGGVLYIPEVTVTNFTVESYVYFEESTSHVSLLARDSGGSQNRIVFYPTYLYSGLDNADVQSQAYAQPLALNTWHHIRFIRTGATFCLIINGVPNVTFGVRNNYTGALTFNNIGGASIYGNTPAYKTYIAEYQFFNTALPYENFDITKPLGNVYTLLPQIVTTTDNSHFSMQQAELIQSLSITNTQPINTSLKAMVSFDGRQTWNYFNGIEWIAASLQEENAVTITTLQSGFTSLSCSGKEFLDIAFFMLSTDIRSTPTVDLVTIVYQDNSSYAPVMIGTDFSIKRINPTTTIIKRLNSNPGKAFINITIG